LLKYARRVAAALPGLARSFVVAVAKEQELQNPAFDVKRQSD